MATTDEIRRRVEEADIARSTQRSAAAQQVGELAQHRAAIAEQLEDIERQLGDVLAAASEVMEIDELARFTDLPAADLTRWLEARKTIRTKRRKPASFAAATKRDTTRAPTVRTSARTSTSNQIPTLPEPTTSQVAGTDTRAPVSADAT